MSERIPTTIDKSWHRFLQPLFDNPRMNEIRDKVLPTAKYYPPPERIFRVFAMPIDKIRVVILGQDPYHNEGEAIGLAFAVSRHKKAPPSLEIIKKEIKDEGVERDRMVNIDSDIWKELIHWKNQGIFLINSALTVEFKIAGSHLVYWEGFTRRVVEIISKEVAPIWILWGSKAKAFKDNIYGGYIPTSPDKLSEGVAIWGDKVNYIIEGNHPAVEARQDNPYKFYGCNHFRICNKILKFKDQNVINW